ILACRSNRNKGLGHNLVIELEGPHGCFLSGFITIKSEDNLPTRTIVGNKTTSNAHMTFSESGPAGRHCGLYSCKMCRHHIGISLYDHQLTLAGNMFLCHIESV